MRFASENDLNHVCDTVLDSNYLFFLREKNKGRDVAVWLADVNGGV